MWRCKGHSLAHVGCLVGAEVERLLNAVCVFRMQFAVWLTASEPKSCGLAIMQQHQEWIVLPVSGVLPSLAAAAVGGPCRMVLLRKVERLKLLAAVKCVTCAYASRLKCD